MEKDDFDAVVVFKEFLGSLDVESLLGDPVDGGAAGPAGGAVGLLGDEQLLATNAHYLGYDGI